MGDYYPVRLSRYRLSENSHYLEHFRKMADVLGDAAEAGLVNIVQIFKRFVDLHSTSKNEEFCQLSGNLRVSDGELKWTGSFDELKLFLDGSLKLDGKWTSSGGIAKKFTCNVPDNNFGITWYFKKQGSLVLQGDPEVSQSVEAMLISLVNTQSDGEMANEPAFNLLNVLYTDQIIEELHISKPDDPDTSSAKLQGETSGDLSGFDNLLTNS